MPQRIPLFLIPCLLLLIPVFLTTAASASVRPEQKAGIGPDAAPDQAINGRVEDVLVRTRERFKAVFGIVFDVQSIIEPSDDDFDLRLTRPASAISTDNNSVLTINSRVVRNYPDEDLQITAARCLYPLIWEKYRKPAKAANALVERMYFEGMTAFAAELLYPGSPQWKYAGIMSPRGKMMYEVYLAREQDLATAVLQALEAGSGSELIGELFPKDGAYRSAWPAGSGPLISYRTIKTFHRDIDPKMIQLMDYAEFLQRLPKGLQRLKSGQASGR